MPKLSVFAMIVLIVGSSHGSVPVSYRIEQVSPSQTPRIVDSRIYYTLDILFNTLPSNHWMFYDRSSSSLVLDFLDIHLDYAPTSIPGQSPFSSIKVSNLTSQGLSAKKSVTGKQSRVSIGLDSIWHFETSTREKSVLTITIWRELRPQLPVQKKESSLLKYASIAVASSHFALALILLLASLPQP